MAIGYFLNRKRTICVVTLNGTLTTADVEVLEKCHKDIKAEPTQYILVHMAGVSDIDSDFVRPFTIFQQALRGDAKLLLCDFQPEVERVLKGGGVLRESELAEDLVAALQLIMRWEKG